MAKTTFTLTKKPQGQKAGKAAGPLKADAGFTIQDNQDGSFTVFGKDAAGVGGIDLSTLATYNPAPVSSDPTVIAVDAPTALTTPTHGLKPGTVSITGTVVFNDGSAGPFPFSLDGTATTGPVTGLDVQFSNPVSR